MLYLWAAVQKWLEITLQIWLHTQTCEEHGKKEKIYDKFCTVYGPNEVQLSTVCMTKLNSEIELVNNTRKSGRPKTVTVSKIINRCKIV